MEEERHLDLLNRGVDVWNNWRKENPALVPNLSEADLREANLSGANLREANLDQADLRGADLRGASISRANLNQADLSGADLSGAYLYTANLGLTNLSKTNLSNAKLSWADLNNAGLIETNLFRADLFRADLGEADLSKANLSGADLLEAILFDANLSGADLSKANLSDANLSGANFFMANLSGADLSGANLFMANLREANLSGADLTRTVLVQTNLSKANLDGCSIYGTSAWGVNLEGTIQTNLLITPFDESRITVDNLEVAQFVYLLLNNEKIRDVINTITSRVVLILGRFTCKRKAVLDAIREEIRRQKLLPIMFDFAPPASQTRLETVWTLAHMARFVIADLTDAKTVLQELQAIVPNNPSVPVQPILLASQEEPGMFDFFHRFPWVLKTYYYHGVKEVLTSLKKIIAGAENARARLDMDSQFSQTLNPNNA